MRRGLTGLLLASGLYLLFLVAELPAARLLGWLSLPPGLGLSGVSGTLWQGQMALVTWQGRQLRAVGWRLNPGSLLLGHPSARLTFADADGLSGEGELGWQGGWQIRDLDLQAPAEALLAAASVPWPVTVSGQVRLQIDEAQFEQADCRSLAGQLRWSQARLGTPLGELGLDEAVAQLGCTQGRLQADVRQSSAQLSLKGRAELGSQRQYRFSGILMPGAELAPPLAGALEQLGRRDSQGQIRLSTQGRF